MAKPRKQKLKVFRTPIGFHDAYVAAPSRRAALEAWGAGTDLFAAGAAELVTDAELTKAPLAKPGTVIRTVRGTAREHVAALGKAGAAKARKAHDESPVEPRKATRRKKPSRAALDKAEAALASFDAQVAKADERLKQEEATLARQRRELERQRTTKRVALQRHRDEARERYQDALSKW